MPGTVLDMSGNRPRSALNLRLVLASFGLAATAVLAVLAIRYQNAALGVFTALLALVTVVDLVVILVRRRRRRRREPGVRHSVFE